MNAPNEPSKPELPAAGLPAPASGFPSAPLPPAPFPAPFPSPLAGPFPGPFPRANALAITALVLGTCGLAIFWVPFAGGVLGLLALVFGLIGRASARHRLARSGYAMSLVGILLGVLALVSSVTVTTWFVYEIHQCDLGRSGLFCD